MNRLLILSVSAGNGHVRAAHALEAAARQRLPSAEVTHLDAMQFVASGFRKLYTDGYLRLVNHLPEMWSYLHQKSDATPHAAASQRLRRAMERLSSGTLLKQVRQRQPAAVLCTHFLPAELLLRERQRGRLDCPVWLQVTDFDLHNMWVVPEMAGYFAATDEVAHRMRARGLAAGRIHVTGIPVMPAFQPAADPTRERAAELTRLGLDPARRCVLVVSGGSGVGDLPQVVGQMLAGAGDFQVIAVAGRNEAARQALEALAPAYPGRLHALGFTDAMHRLMAAADLVVTKPGGLTVSECLALGKPMLLVSPIPGQEEHNAGYLMEHGAAWLAYDGIGLLYKLQRLMTEPRRLAAMAAASSALGRPAAAHAVLDQVLGAAGS